MSLTRRILFVILVFSTFLVFGQSGKISELTVGDGWASNSVNATIFRKNSVVSGGGYQFVAYYDQQGYLVVGKRKLSESFFVTTRSAFTGNIKDAHNSISIMLDGDGYLHVSWDHHNTRLNYARSNAPYATELIPAAMTGYSESSVTYPEFHRLPSGDLLFFYRSGESGRGDLVINKYSVKTHIWTQIQHNLLDGQEQRNAYWQACVDAKGVIHLSWVWRESWDVATNHDMSYARSTDGGQTWQRSDGSDYTLPITMAEAEVAWQIPQNSELINQTSITTTSAGMPVIATYWRAQGETVPQFFVLYKSSEGWKTQQVSRRKTAFSLSGGGTKAIPISRPQVLARSVGKHTEALLIFRDVERGNKPSVFINRDFPKGSWEVFDLSKEDLGAWEPSYDTERWRLDGILDLYMQAVTQGDGESLIGRAQQPVKILEWNPNQK